MKIILAILIISSIAWGVGEMMALCYRWGLERGVRASHTALSKQLMSSDNYRPKHNQILMAFDRLLSKEIAHA